VLSNLSEGVRALPAYFVALRGSGPYDPPTMMEAALVTEELLGVTCPDHDLSEANLGSAEAFERYFLRRYRGVQGAAVSPIREPRSVSLSLGQGPQE